MTPEGDNYTDYVNISFNPKEPNVFSLQVKLPSSANYYSFQYDFTIRHTVKKGPQ